MQQQFLAKILPLCVGVFVLSIIIGCAALAWTEPNTLAPNGNVAAPINTGSTIQTKSGGLNISGNVGIGTTTPGAKLDVSGNTMIGSLGLIRMGFTSTSGDYYNPLTGESDRDHFHLFFSVPSGKYPLIETPSDLWLIGGSSNLKVDGSAVISGNVTVNGQIKITGGSPGAGKVLTSDANGLATWQSPSGGSITGSGTTNYITKFTGTTSIGNSLIFDNGTNVGIGTTSPGTKLSVAGEISSTSANAFRMVTGNYGAFWRNDGGDVYLLLTNSGDQYGSWNSLRPLRINNSTGNVYFSQNTYFPGSGIWNTSGNVGIGTTSPGYKLTVAGGAIGGNYGITPNYVAWNTYGTGDGGAAIYNDNGTYKKLMIIGNNSAGGKREIGLWDNVTVNGNVVASGNVSAPAFYYNSDASLKKDITPINNSLQKIKDLNGVYFKWKSNNKPAIGLIAQDVEKVFPEAVTADANTGIKSVDYGQFVAPLIEAVKEQQKEIESLKARINELESKTESPTR